MADRHFPAERDVGKYLLHDPRRVDRLTRAQVQEIDVQTVGLIGEVRGDPDGKPFRMRRACSTVGMQSRQLTLALDDFRVSIEELRKLTINNDADMGGKVRIFLHKARGGAHDELKMRNFIAARGPDHQKSFRRGGPSVQTVSAIKHEYLERRDP